LIKISYKGEIPIEKNVIVTDELGNQIGNTYPKRARGLIKNGRAEFVNAYEIRLSTHCSSNILEEKTMDNRLYFNAREWKFNPDCENNVGERTFITGLDGKLVEVYTLGNWGWEWSEITSKQLTLQKNTEYSFTFWLNGGENDRNNEVCRLQIIFNNDYENSLIYKLNRNYIKPLKRYKGWELYEIPFTTEDNEYTELRFVAQAAYMAVMPAKDKEEYADMPDEVDEFYNVRPQRHNMVFDDGWPNNTWYSTGKLKISSNKSKNLNNNFNNNPNIQGFNSSNIKNDFQSRLMEKILDEIDIDSIQEEIVEMVDIDDILAEIDFDSINEEFMQIKRELKSH
jgi:hypothetical protein